MERNIIPVFIRGIKKILSGKYKNPKPGNNKTISLHSNRHRYKVFKCTELNGETERGKCFFEVEFKFKKWVPEYFAPTIPFFIGMPGFISKLWLVDETTGVYAGQYIFDSRENAMGYGNSFAQKLVKKLCLKGFYRWQAVEMDTV